MTDKKKHIDLFEELIRILSLKKQFNPESLESSVARIDMHYVPDNEKTEKLFDELEIYYKSQKPGRKYPYFLWVFLFSVFLIGIIVLFPKKQIEVQSEKPTLDTTHIKEAINDTIDKKEILYNETLQGDSLIDNNIDSSKMNLPAINNIDTIDLGLQKLRSQAMLNDSILEKLTIPDTSSKENADTLLSYMNKYCNLPEEYTFLFSNRSIVINEIYKDDLIDVVTKIKNCPNLRTIDIKASYTRKFIFFSNKKIASERIDSMLKNLKRNGVTIKMMRNKEIEFIRIPKNEYSESFEKVEILLDY